MNTTSANSANSAAYDSLALAGRILLAAIFILSGISKVTAPEATIAYIASAGVPLPQIALAGAIVVELLGGVALVIGVKTRLVAAALAVFSLVAAAFFHNALADQNQFIHFFKNIAMAGGLLQVVAFGPGRLSLDRR